MNAFIAGAVTALFAGLVHAADPGWETYLPGQYDAQDSATLKAFRARLAQISATGGNVRIQDVVAGKLTNANNPSVSWNPMENDFLVTKDNADRQARMYAADNPLFTDAAYARRKLGEAVAFPLVLTLECMPALPKREGIGDYFVVSSHNDTMTYLRPIHEGDRLFTVYTDQHADDITPAAGSTFRTFAVSGSCKVYNQRAELVAEGANILKESFRRHADPALRNPDHAQAWESPDWWQRKPHHYTDGDWAKVVALWKNEAPHRSAPLYWEDVKVGDHVGPVATPPILLKEETDMTFEVPAFATDIKRQALDPASAARMVPNELGIRVLPEDLKKQAAQKAFTGAGRDTDTNNARTAARTPEIANRDGRATVQNAVIGKFAAAMVYDWAGDSAWLQRIGWDIMWTIPGYSEAVIPPIPRQLYPALFDKFPVLDAVPGMRGDVPFWHALEGDIVFLDARVTKKYDQGGEHFVDVTWWAKTFDGDMVERGFATLKLPRKPH